MPSFSLQQLGSLAVHSYKLWPNSLKAKHEGRGLLTRHRHQSGTIRSKARNDRVFGTDTQPYEHFRDPLRSSVGHGRSDDFPLAHCARGFTLEQHWCPSRADFVVHMEKWDCLRPENTLSRSDCATRFLRMDNNRVGSLPSACDQDHPAMCFGVLQAQRGSSLPDGLTRSKRRNIFSKCLCCGALVWHTGHIKPSKSAVGATANCTLDGLDSQLEWAGCLPEHSSIFFLDSGAHVFRRVKLAFR